MHPFLVIALQQPKSRKDCRSALGLNSKKSKLQRRLNFQLQQDCHNKVRVTIGKNGTPIHEIEHLSQYIKKPVFVNPWLIHVNVWQRPLQYCKVISLQLIKINGKK